MSTLESESEVRSTVNEKRIGVGIVEYGPRSNGLLPEESEEFLHHNNNIEGDDNNGEEDTFISLPFGPEKKIHSLETISLSTVSQQKIPSTFSNGDERDSTNFRMQDVSVEMTLDVSFSMKKVKQ